MRGTAHAAQCDASVSSFVMGRVPSRQCATARPAGAPCHARQCPLRASLVRRAAGPPCARPVARLRQPAPRCPRPGSENTVLHRARCHCRCCQCQSSAMAIMSLPIGHERPPLSWKHLSSSINSGQRTKDCACSEVRVAGQARGRQAMHEAGHASCRRARCATSFPLVGDLRAASITWPASAWISTECSATRLGFLSGLERVGLAVVDHAAAALPGRRGGALHVGSTAAARAAAARGLVHLAWRPLALPRNAFTDRCQRTYLLYAVHLHAVRCLATSLPAVSQQAPAPAPNAPSTGSSTLPWQHQAPRRTEDLQLCAVLQSCLTIRRCIHTEQAFGVSTDTKKRAA